MSGLQTIMPNRLVSVFACVWLAVAMPAWAEERIGRELQSGVQPLGGRDPYDPLRESHARSGLVEKVKGAIEHVDNAQRSNAVTRAVAEYTGEVQRLSVQLSNSSVLTEDEVDSDYFTEASIERGDLSLSEHGDAYYEFVQKKLAASFTENLDYDGERAFIAQTQNLDRLLQGNVLKQQFTLRNAEVVQDTDNTLEVMRNTHDLEKTLAEGKKFIDENVAKGVYTTLEGETRWLKHQELTLVDHALDLLGTADSAESLEALDEWLNGEQGKLMPPEQRYEINTRIDAREKAIDAENEAEQDEKEITRSRDTRISLMAKITATPTMIDTTFTTLLEQNPDLTAADRTILISHYGQRRQEWDRLENKTTVKNLQIRMDTYRAEFLSFNQRQRNTNKDAFLTDLSLMKLNKDITAEQAQEFEKQLNNVEQFVYDRVGARGVEIEAETLIRDLVAGGFSGINAGLLMSDIRTDLMAVVLEGKDPQAWWSQNMHHYLPGEVIERINHNTTQQIAP